MKSEIDVLALQCRIARNHFDKAKSAWLAAFNRQEREYRIGWKENPPVHPVAIAERQAYRVFKQSEQTWQKCRQALADVAELNQAELASLMAMR